MADTLWTVAQEVSTTTGANPVEVTKELISSIGAADAIVTGLPVFPAYFSSPIDSLQQKELFAAREGAWPEYSTRKAKVQPELPSESLGKAVKFSPGFGYVPEYARNFQSFVDPQMNKVQQPRVFKGLRVTASSAEEDPYADALLITGNNKLCTGTLVAPDKVVYAAHCFAMEFLKRSEQPRLYSMNIGPQLSTSRLPNRFLTAPI